MPAEVPECSTAAGEPSSSSPLSFWCSACSKGTAGEERRTEQSSEVSGDLKLPLLGVKSFKMIAAACPQ
jgi:hypothetical protein